MQTFNLLTLQAQYTGMLAQLDVPRPAVLQRFNEALAVLSLDITVLLGRAAIPKITARAVFVIVSVLLPMCLNVLLILQALPLYAVVWYLSFICGIVLTLVGIVGVATPDAATTTDIQRTADNVLIIGASMTGAATLAWLVTFAAKKGWFGVCCDCCKVETEEDKDKKKDSSADGTSAADSKPKAIKSSSSNEPTADDGDEEMKKKETEDEEEEEADEGEDVLADSVSAGDVDLKGFLNSMTKEEKRAFRKLTRSEQWERRLKWSLEHERDQTVDNDIVKQKEYDLKFHRFRTLRHFLQTAVLVIVGTIFVGGFSVGSVGDDLIAHSSAYFGIGVFLLCLGGLSFFYMVSHFCEKGRAAIQSIFGFENRLRIILTLVLVGFIPICSNSVNIFMCAEYSCPVGSAFNPHASRPLGTYSRDPKYYCDKCNFNATPGHVAAKTCGGATVPNLCNGYSGTNNIFDPTSRCDDGAGYAFMVLAALIVLVSFGCGVPLSFGWMTKTLTALVAEQAKIVLVTADDNNNNNNNKDEEPMDEADIEEKNWQKQQAAVPLVAGSLYAPFKHAMKYYSVYELIQRFLFVIILNVIAPFSSVATALLLAAHAVFMIVLLVLRPYADISLQIFACLLAGANVLNSTLFVVLWATSSPDKFTGFAVFAIVANALISVIGGIIFAILEFRARGKREEVADEEETAVIAMLEADELAEQRRLDEKKAAAEAKAAAKAAEAEKRAAEEAAAAAAAAAAAKAAEEEAAAAAAAAAAAEAEAEDAVENEPQGETEEEKEQRKKQKAAAAAAAKKEKKPVPAAPTAPAPAPAFTPTPAPLESDLAVAEASANSASTNSAVAVSPSPVRRRSTAGLDDASKQRLIREATERREHREKHNLVVTTVINAQTVESISNVFRIIGIVIAFGFFFAMLGVLEEQPLMAHVGSDALYQTTEDTLGGFYSFTNFTENCCCTAGTATFSDYNVTERWVCSNGKSVTRARVSKDGAQNGIPIRGLCSTGFATGCALVVEAGTSRTRVNCDSTFKAANPSVSGLAYLLYW